jgi:hypothetical protein
MRNDFHGVKLDLDGNWPYQPLSDNEIRAFEERLGTKLPKLIIEFYLLFNGCQFGERCCIACGSDYQVINSLSIINSNNLDLDFYELYQASDSEFWPKHLIPFGHDAGGHAFCFSIAPDSFGAIFFHMSEWTGEPEELQFIAEDFLSFLQGLRLEADFE